MDDMRHTCRGASAPKRRCGIGVSHTIPAKHCLIGLACFVLISCTAHTKPRGVCARQFTDNSIRQIVTDELKLVGDYEIRVNWTRCRYYLLILTPSRAPDSEIIVTLDEYGRIVDGPR